MFLLTPRSESVAVAQAAYLLSLYRQSYLDALLRCDLDRQHGFAPLPRHTAELERTRRVYARARLAYRQFWRLIKSEIAATALPEHQP